MIENTYRLWEGSSLFNGDDICMMSTGHIRGSNTKLGPNFVQVYIMHSSLNPYEAKATGADSAVCGDCKLRNGICYVSRPFRQMWLNWSERDTPWITPMALETMEVQKRFLRLSAYGDVANVPLEIFTPLIDRAAGITGYTHGWAGESGQPYQPYCMASVASVAEAELAQSKGWQTFRVKLPDEPLLPGEIHCPEQKTSGMVRCENCMLCSPQRGKNIAINVHGIGGKIEKFKSLKA